VNKNFNIQTFADVRTFASVVALLRITDVYTGNKTSEVLRILLESAAETSPQRFELEADALAYLSDKGFALGQLSEKRGRRLLASVGLEAKLLDENPTQTHTSAAARAEEVRKAMEGE